MQILHLTESLLTSVILHYMILLTIMSIIVFLTTGMSHVFFSRLLSGRWIQGRLWILCGNHPTCPATLRHTHCYLQLWSINTGRHKLTHLEHFTLLWHPVPMNKNHYNKETTVHTQTKVCVREGLQLPALVNWLVFLRFRWCSLRAL